MEGYEEIFKKRGKSYHNAMEAYPYARDEEFMAIVSYLDKRDDSVVLDLPAGGGYLKRFLPKGVHYLAYDFAGEFEDNHTSIRKCRESKIDLEDQSVDEVVTLAALHHIVDRKSFYSEIHRVLKPKGKFVIGDVVEGSRVDPFLNGFLNRWNSMGHKGVFINPKRDAFELRNAGFHVNYSVKDFFWNFNSCSEAQSYFRKLFFLDLSPSKNLLSKELDKLGMKKENGKVKVRWSLGFLVGERT